MTFNFHKLNHVQSAQNRKREKSDNLSGAPATVPTERFHAAEEAGDGAGELGMCRALPDVLILCCCSHYRHLEHKG